MPGDRRPRRGKSRTTPLEGRPKGRGKKTASDAQTVENQKPVPTDEEKAAYRSEIERRFAELGWTEQSMNFPTWSMLKAEWLALLEPNELKDLNDDKVWGNIKQSVQLLQDRIKTEREKQKELRFDRLSRLLSALKKDSPPLVAFNLRRLGKPPCTEYPCPPLDYTELKKVPHEMAFPGMADVHKWPIIKSLLEADTTADQLEQDFNARREEIDTMVSEWRDKLHARLLGFLPKLNGDILQPTLVADGSDPFKDLSDDMKRLLRADSLFLVYDWNESPYTINSSRNQPYTYQDILRIHPGGSVHRLGDLHKQVESPIDSIRAYPAAQEIARELMNSIGRPNASYLELGCEIEGECDWEGVSSYSGEWIVDGVLTRGQRPGKESQVEHYVVERQTYQSSRAELAKRKMTYHDLHSSSITNRPMIRFYSAQVAREVPFYGADERDMYQCWLCSKWPLKHGVQGSRESMVKHLLEVHGVKKPLSSHYGPPTIDYMY